MVEPTRILVLAIGLCLGGAGAASAEETARPVRTERAFFAEDVCRAIEAEARRRGLPASFFARLIWRESLFSPSAVSRKGAQGIAQFLPATAVERGLGDPFDTASALAASAEYLKDLKSRFGSLGLAAAAYNAGPTRLARWIAGTSELPLETQDYVLWITGHSAQDWSTGGDGLETLPIAENMSFTAACRKLAVRGLTAKLPDTSLRASGWQRLFAAGLGIKQVAASKPGRIRILIDPTKFDAKPASKAGRKRK